MKVWDEADVIRFPQDRDGERLRALMDRANASLLSSGRPYTMENLLQAMDDLARTSGWLTRRWWRKRGRPVWAEILSRWRSQHEQG